MVLLLGALLRWGWPDRLAAALIALLLVRCHLSSSEVRAAPGGLQGADARGNSSDSEFDAQVVLGLPGSACFEGSTE